ncbi:MAG: hypothetical protein ACRDSH_02055 [Pseudonocardiaceae bacterium]
MLRFDPYALAARLNHLFEAHERLEGRKLSNDTVAEDIRASGTQITGSFIWNLRNKPAEIHDPSLTRLMGLANYFGVSLAELLAWPQREQSSPVQLKAMRALEGIRSCEGLQQILNVIEMVARLEEVEARLDPTKE